MLINPSIAALTAKLAKEAHDNEIVCGAWADEVHSLKAKLTCASEKLAAAEARVVELEEPLRIIASYTGHDPAAWVAKELARNVLTDKGVSQ